MRPALKLSLFLATFAFVLACSEEPKGVAAKPQGVKARPVASSTTTAVQPKPVALADVEPDMDFTDDDAAVLDDALARAEGTAAERVEEPTLLEQEALFHDDMDTVFFLEGQRLLAEGKPGEAVTAFRKALFDMQDADTWRGLGESYLASGKRERGAACLEQALQKDPNLVNVRERLARVYLDTHPDRSRAHAEVIARARPDDAGAHYAVGRAYMKLSMWNEAVASFERALTIDPTSSYAHNNLGYSALQIGRADLALQHLEAILDLSPQEPYMLNNLGIAYEKAGRGADAFAAYLRALELKPGYVNALVNKQRLQPTLSEAEQAVALEILEELAAESVAGETTASVEAEGEGHEVIVLTP